jgi:predicted phosphodiesterase
MTRVLVIGDVHEPASHPGYLSFCQHLAEKWETERVVFIGDILDMHTVSFHPREPGALGAEDEAEQTRRLVSRWHKGFPDATVTIGNHDERVHRLASSVNIPARFIREFADVWGTPSWKWVRAVAVDRVTYLHGTGCGGATPALNAARKSMGSVVCGHVHSAGGVHWAAGPTSRIFGMDTGCGIDAGHPAMNYGRNMLAKPILSAGVVLDGIPYHEPMPCGRGEAFHRSKFKGKR